MCVMKGSVHFVSWQENNHLQTNNIKLEDGSNFTVFESFNRIHKGHRSYMKMDNGALWSKIKIHPPKHTQEQPSSKLFIITFRWKFLAILERRRNVAGK